MTRRNLTALSTTVVSLAALGTAAAVVLSWRDTLPDPLAVHWGLKGVADGFSSVGAFVGATTAAVGAVVCLFALLSVAAGRPQSPSRTMTGATVYMGFMGAAIMLLTAATQRGTSAASSATLPPWVLAVALLAPLAPAVIAGLLVPTEPVANAQAAPPADLPHVQAAIGEVPAWHGTTRARPILFATVEILVLWSLTAVAFVTQQWWWALIAVVLAAAISMGLAYRIVADERGLTVSSWPGWPSKRILAHQIDGVEFTKVSPLADFGGWGYRMGAGGVEGIVTRKGPGIRVHYGQGRTLVVTVNKDALGAAATLNTAAQEAFRNQG